MAGIMDLLASRGMPQRPQGTGMSMPPQGGMDPGMPSGGGDGLLRQILSSVGSAPQGMPGAAALNRPAGPDIMALIQMLLGGGSSPQLPPLEMLEGGGGGPSGPEGPEIAASMAPQPKAARISTPSAKPKPKKKARPEREDESRAGKMGIRTQKGEKKRSAADKMTDDMVASDRVGVKRY